MSDIHNLRNSPGNQDLTLNRDGNRGGDRVGGDHFNEHIENRTNNKVNERLEGENKTGSGTIDQTGKVPTPPTDPSYSVVLNSLLKFMPEDGGVGGPRLTGQMIEVMLLEITMKMKEIEEKASKNQIVVDQETKRSMLSDKHEKMEAAQQKIEEGQKTAQDTKAWDIVKLVFQGIGAAMAIVLGGIFIATGVGAAIGVAMIAIGAVGLVSVINSAMQMGTGAGIMGNIVKAAGGNEEQVRTADMVYGIALAAAGVIMAVAAFFIPGGQMSAIAQMAQSIATISGAVLNIVTAAGDVTVGVVRTVAAGMQAEGQKLQAQGKEMEAVIQQLDDFIDQALQRLMASSDRYNNMIDDIMSAIQDTGHTLAKATFTG
jgi:hypothetical protein